MKNPFRTIARFRPLKAIAQFISRMPHPTIYSLLRMVGTKHDFEAVVGDGQGSSVVMAPLMWLARNSVQAHLELYKTEDGEPMQHAMMDLLHRPNEYYNGRHLQMAILLSLCSSGNAYLIKIRAGKNSPPAELWYAPHSLMEPMADYDSSGNVNFIDYYKYHVEGVTELDPRDVIHIRYGINPRNVRYGLSPLYPALREIWGDIESANYTAAILKNMGMPGVIISPDSDEPTIIDLEAKEVAETFKAKFGGDQRGQAMVMKGKTKVEQFGFDPSKMEIKVVRDVSEERVCACLGIPAAVVGFGTGMEQTKVGATMNELRQEAWEGGLIPYLELIADALETALLPEFERRPELYRLGYNYSNVRALSESEDAKHRRAVANVNAGIWTVSRAQRYLGDEPDPSQDIYLRRTTVIETPAQLPKARQMLMLKSAKQKPPRNSARLLAELAREQRRLEPEWEAGVLKVLDSLATALVQSAEDLLGGKALKQAIVDDVLKPIDLNLFEAELSTVFSDLYLRTATSTIGAINTVLGVQVRMTDPMAEQIVATGGRRAGLVDLSGSTRARLFRELAEGQRLGEGVPQLIRRIRDVPAGPWNNSVTRARVIARTETMHAQRTSALHSYREMNPTARVMVFDGRLPTSCEDCMMLDGTVVSQDEAWALADTEHPNGTRAFVIYYE